MGQQVYNTHGTFTFSIPGGVTSLKIEGYGSGSSGQNGASLHGTPVGGKGGLGGGYARVNAYSPTATDLTNGLTVVVGQGGSGNFTTGNNSTVSGSAGTIILAAGGQQTPPSQIGDVTEAISTGGSGVQGGGGGGSSAGNAAAGVNGGNASGTTGGTGATGPSS